MSERATYGKRLSFELHQTDKGDIYVSRKIFTNGIDKMVRLHIDRVNMEWSIVDAVTGASYASGGENITNQEVLVRSAKRNLKKLLAVDFEVEKRNVKSKSESNG